MVREKLHNQRARSGHVNATAQQYLNGDNCQRQIRVISSACR